MCGICGVASLRLDEQFIEKETLVKMTKKLVHRGPDDEGYLIGKGIGFGFRRLSIIDLCTGNQPLSNEDGSIHVVCNGEIFNYGVLRQQLITKGHSFRSRADTEVLVHLYEEEGDAMVNRLNGQFAFAIFDDRIQHLLIARDHFGVSPLFYTVVHDTLVFASEIKAILAHPEVKRRVDLTGLDQILTLPGLVAPRTMFAGIHSLPAGHLLDVSSGNIRLRQYWDVHYPKESELVYKPESYYIDSLETHLLQSIRYRLQSDVPVGSYLSGGLDSSLIASMMKTVSSEPKTTFSVAFQDANFSEEKYQKLMSNYLGFRHQEIRLNAQDIAETLRKSIWHCECPVKESYSAATYALSGAAQKQGIKVVLSGEGADELFAGYTSYRFDAFRRQNGMDSTVAPEAAALRGRLWGDSSFCYDIEPYSLRSVKQSLFSDQLNALYGEFDFSNFGIIQKEKLEGLHILHKRSYLDLKLRLADHLLADPGDRMLFAHSVEGRYPYLDVDVLNLVAEMPPDLKLHGFQEKYILRKVGQKYLPPEIAKREKFPFAGPGSPHLIRLDLEWVNDLLSPETIAQQGYFNPSEVARLRKCYSDPKFMLSIPHELDALMIVLTFGIFLNLFEMPNLC